MNKYFLLIIVTSTISLSTLSASVSATSTDRTAIAPVQYAQVQPSQIRRKGRQDIRQYKQVNRQNIRSDRAAYYASRPIGYRVATLPSARIRLIVHGAAYYYHSGIYYRFNAGRYVVIRAPYGARLRVLPYGYRTIAIGARRYFYVNNTYYTYDTPTNEYIVVNAPISAEQALSTASNESPEDLFVYPNDDQTEADTDRDRYECHRWAVGQSGYDPSHLNHSTSTDTTKYIRAQTACLEGRGYTVK